MTESAKSLLKHIDYISGIRKELLSIENNVENINGLTESQWVAIRAAHRLLGEYIEKEQKSAEWSEEEVDIDEAARKWQDKVYLEKGWQDEYGIPHIPFSEIGNAFIAGFEFGTKTIKGEL